MQKNIIHKVVDNQSQSQTQFNADSLKLQLHVETDKLVSALKDISARIETHATRHVVHLDQVTEAIKDKEFKHVTVPDIKVDVPETKVVMMSGGEPVAADNKHLYVVGAILISPFLDSLVKYLIAII